MSLINEALKKAQRSRNAEPAGETKTPFDTTGPVAKRGKARSSQTVVLIASGAIVLIVLSAVITFWLANRPGSQPEKTVAKAPTPKAPTQAEKPLVVPAVNPPPPSTAPINPAPTPTTSTNPGPSNQEKTTKSGETKASGVAPQSVETKPATPPTNSAPAPTTTANPPGAPANSTAPSTTPVNPAPTSAPPASGTATTPSTTTAEAATATPPSTPPAPAGPAKPDERIATFVETLRVTAIRANDAKIIMNDKVYRVNDIIDRTLGVRLIKVANDSLTFSDANGVTYVKYF